MNPTPKKESPGRWNSQGYVGRSQLQIYLVLVVVASTRLIFPKWRLIWTLLKQYWKTSPGGGFKYVFMFNPEKLGDFQFDEYFFRWVGSTTNSFWWFFRVFGLWCLLGGPEALEVLSSGSWSGGWATRVRKRAWGVRSTTILDPWWLGVWARIRWMTIVFVWKILTEVGSKKRM